MRGFEDNIGVPFFEIPIYAFSPEEYEKRWNRKKSAKIRKLMTLGNTQSYSENLIHEEYYYKSTWQYNKMVGMLLLTVKKHSLFFNLYCNKKPPRNILSETTLPFINKFLINVDFDLSDIHTDEQLVATIKEWIESLKVTEQIESYYFDCRAFEA
ncbi:MAG: hypothetical protein RR336_04205, partial [Oscillospiraceae bacterium]